MGQATQKNEKKKEKKQRNIYNYEHLTYAGKYNYILFNL